MFDTAAKSFRAFFLLLIFFLWTVLNLERLQYAAGLEVIGIHNFVYLMILLVISKIVIFPPEHRISEWMHASFALLVYTVGRLTIFKDEGVFGGVQTYVTITELLVLSLAVIITSRVMEHFNRLEEVLDEVFIPGAQSRVVEPKDAKYEINKEISRCRRYRHPLSLLVVRPEPGESKIDVSALMEEMRRYGLNRFVGASVAKMLADQTRRSDTIIRGGGSEGTFMVLCPETPGEGSMILAERIKRQASDAGINISYGIASFPDEAITYDDLLKAAEMKIKTRDPIQPVSLPAGKSKLDEAGGS